MRICPRERKLIEFISICGRSSRGSSAWRTRSSTSVGCGSTISIEQCQALSHCQRPHPPVEGWRPWSRDGTLLRPARFPGAFDPVAAHGVIGINSKDDGVSLNLFRIPQWFYDEGVKEKPT